MFPDEVERLSAALLALPFATPSARGAAHAGGLPRKIARRDSAEAFCAFSRTVEEADKKHAERLENSVSSQFQPYVHCVGTFPGHLERVFVRFLDHHYVFDNILIINLHN